MAQVKGVATITSKGQVTIPKEIRDRFGLRAGDQLEFAEDESGIRVRRHFETSPFEKWRGYLKHLKGRSTDELIEEMRGSFDG